MKSIFIFGSGAHGRVVAEAALQCGKYEIKGFADDDPGRQGAKLDQWEVLGGWREPVADSWVIAVGNNAARQRLFQQLQAANRSFETIVSPRAYVSPTAIIGQGTVVLAGAVVQAGACIGCNAIINAGAVIDHDALVGDHAHVGPNATVTCFGTVAPAEVLAAGTVRSRIQRAGAFA